MHLKVRCDDLHGMCALFNPRCAGYRGDADKVQELVNLKANLHAADALGNSPLHLAAFNGHTKVIRYHGDIEYWMTCERFWSEIAELFFAFPQCVTRGRCRPLSPEWRIGHAALHGCPVKQLTVCEAHIGKGMHNVRRASYNSISWLNSSLEVDCTLNKILSTLT